jgi:hypothetical protein
LLLALTDDESKMLRDSAHEVGTGENRNGYKILARNTEGVIPLARRRRRGVYLNGSL